MRPHSAFSYIRADEVAECWDGIGDAMYSKLWDIVGHQAPIPNLEDSGPHDHIGHECLAKQWHRLSEAEQAELNRLANAREDQS